MLPPITAARWQVAGKLERCVETRGRRGLQQEAPQQRPPGVQPPGGGRPTRRRAPARPCILGWHDVLRVGRRRTPRPCRMTCPLHRLATTTPTSWWSVSMPPGWRGSVSAAMRPPHRGHSSRRWSAEAQGDEYQQARWQPDQHLQIERIPPRRLNRYLEPLRSSATCAKGGPHSGYRHLADKDEAGGSSPPRPTTPALTSPNAGPRLRSLLGGANSGSRTLTWLPVLVMRQAV
jgi:hypothetical protein